MAKLVLVAAGRREALEAIAKFTTGSDRLCVVLSGTPLRDGRALAPLLLNRQVVAEGNIFQEEGQGIVKIMTPETLRRHWYGASEELRDCSLVLWGVSDVACECASLAAVAPADRRILAIFDTADRLFATEFATWLHTTVQSPSPEARVWVLPPGATEALRVSDESQCARANARARRIQCDFVDAVVGAARRLRPTTIYVENDGDGESIARKAANFLWTDPLTDEYRRRYCTELLKDDEYLRRGIALWHGGLPKETADPYLIAADEGLVNLVITTPLSGLSSERVIIAPRTPEFAAICVAALECSARDIILVLPWASDDTDPAGALEKTQRACTATQRQVAISTSRTYVALTLRAAAAGAPDPALAAERFAKTSFAEWISSTTTQRTKKKKKRRRRHKEQCRERLRTLCRTPAVCGPWLQRGRVGLVVDEERWAVILEWRGPQNVRVLLGRDDVDLPVSRIRLTAIRVFVPRNLSVDARDAVGRAVRDGLAAFGDKIMLDDLDVFFKAPAVPSEGLRAVRDHLLEDDEVTFDEVSLVSRIRRSLDTVPNTKGVAIAAAVPFDDRAIVLLRCMDTVSDASALLIAVVAALRPATSSEILPSTLDDPLSSAARTVYQAIHGGTFLDEDDYVRSFTTNPLALAVAVLVDRSFGLDTSRLLLRNIAADFRVPEAHLQALLAPASIVLRAVEASATASSQTRLEALAVATHAALAHARDLVDPPSIYLRGSSSSSSSSSSGSPVASC